MKTSSDGLRLQAVDPSSTVPRYVQAKQILIGAIQQGALPRGSKLPSTHDVSGKLGVSLLTAHKAIQCLVQEGWLNRERGRGTFVREDFEGSVKAKARFMVGLLLDAQTPLGDYYHTSLLNGLRKASTTNELGADLVWQHCPPDEIGNLTIDGMICFHPELDSFDKLEAINADLPIVVLGGSTRGSKLHCIDSANEHGARAAVAHLAELGHRDIGIINGRLSVPNSLHRFKGFVSEMGNRGLELRDEYVINSETAEMSETVKSRLRSLLQKRSRPTAILAAGYYLSLEVLEVADSLGIRIPQDLSLVGFDDPKSAALLNPALTTVRQPLELMGRKAIQRILELIAGTSSAAQNNIEVLPTEFIVRASTSSPAPR